VGYVLILGSVRIELKCRMLTSVCRVGELVVDVEKLPYLVSDEL
jgi:hypothetical protein